MNIRSKLLISNILMLFLPLIISVVFALILFSTFLSKFWMPLENMYKDQNGIFSARGIIYAFGDVIDNKSITIDNNNMPGPGTYILVEKPLPVLDNKEVDLLEEELLMVGYHFQIISNGNVIFSNMSASDSINMNRLISGTEVMNQQNFIITQENYSALKTTFGDNNIEIYAINFNDSLRNSNASTYIQRFVNPTILIFLLTITLMIVILSYSLSIWVKRLIISPLNKLKTGTREISRGNLEFKIDYNKNDEFGAVIQDFNEMRKHLKDSIDQKKALEEYRKSMIAGISHDLRTPLTSIIGYTEGLRDGIANSDEKREKYYQAIYTRALDMQHLVSTLTSLYLLSNDTINYKFEVVDGFIYINNWVKSYESEPNSKRLNITLTNKAGRRNIKIDKNELSRVFVNLLDNSIKYSGKDVTDVRITLDNSGDNFRISVKDNGKGVSPTSIDKIFDSFYREDESRNLNENSHGLGLSIVKEIITLHNGTIEARTNNGLEIIIVLPINSVGGKNEKYFNCRR